MFACLSLGSARLKQISLILYLSWIPFHLSNTDMTLLYLKCKIGIVSYVTYPDFCPWPQGGKQQCIQDFGLHCSILGIE